MRRATSARRAGRSGRDDGPETRAGTPIASLPGGMSETTYELEATIASRPTRQPA
jgi:hypothetical protein